MEDGKKRWRKKDTPREGESVRIFQEAVRTEETWLQYERRFWRFLDWLGETPDSFLDRTRNNKIWTGSKIMEYIMAQKERVRRKEIQREQFRTSRSP